MKDSDKNDLTAWIVELLDCSGSEPIPPSYQVSDWALIENRDQWGGQAEAAIGESTLDAEVLVLRLRRHDVIVVVVAEGVVESTPNSGQNSRKHQLKF